MELDVGLPLSDDAYEYGKRSSGDTHGLVLTKSHIVDLILDMAGYTTDKDLTKLKLLEPACGHGAFLLRAVERLLASVGQLKPKRMPDLSKCISGFDIEATHVEVTRAAVIERLLGHGLEEPLARQLAGTWIRQGDFLLAKVPETFDIIVGNPPYIRIEQLSEELQAVYRSRFDTLYDRADLYVAFIERSLSLLSPEGVLSFICADRWTLNRYGAPLRELITSKFAVHAYIDLHDASPFESEVIAYPSIFVIGRESSERPTTVARLATGSESECMALRDPSFRGATVDVQEHTTWFKGNEPWVLSSPANQRILRDLEARFPLLEGEQTSVRIGVATGNDKVLIVPADADIERSRLVPLVMRSDIEGGKVKDGRRCVINTYADDGSGVVALIDYPKLARYLEAHESALRKRHVAKSGRGWFKTIDRVYPAMVKMPKLLIPDIAGANEVVFEPGNFYPHHNLYFVLSDVWDMEVLGGLLSSRVALFFVWSYAVKMRGGYLRFQAQYLRRIRLPPPHSLPPRLAGAIRTAFRKRDFKALDALAAEAYGLTSLPEFDFVDTRR